MLDSQIFYFIVCLFLLQFNARAHKIEETLDKHDIFVDPSTLEPFFDTTLNSLFYTSLTLLIA